MQALSIEDWAPSICLIKSRATVCLGMGVRFLDYFEADGSKFVSNSKDGGPAKWLRTVTTSSATTFRV